MNRVLHEASFDAEGVDRIESRMWDFDAHHKWPLDIGGLAEVAVELADNAVQHSGQDGGWVSVQEHDRPFHHLTVVITDQGVGLPQRVREAVAPESVDDYQAMGLAFQPRLTSTGDTRRGFRLTIALEFTGRALGSVFSLESGHAAYAATGGVGRVLSKGSRPVPGVIARVTVPLRGE